MRITLQQVIEWLHIDFNAVSFDPMTEINGVSTDTRTLQPGNLYIPLKGDRFNGHDFVDAAIEAGAHAVLWQYDHPFPEQNVPLIIVGDTLRALQQLAQCYRHERGIPVIAVTGSNGKTTTKDLIAAVLSGKYQVHKTKGNLNNHIGVPLTLLATPDEAEVAVVEMGMNHAGEISLLSQIAEPDYAVITNIGEAHIEYFHDRRGIAKAKLEIIDGLKSDGMLWINGDDTLLVDETQHDDLNVRQVGFFEGATEGAQNVTVMSLHTTRFTATRDGVCYELPLIGAHNVRNALFALAVGRHFGMSGKEMMRCLKRAEISGGRMQLKYTKRGMTVIDDTYNASPTAVKASVETLMQFPGKHKRWVLIGDILELGNQEAELLSEVGRFLAERGLDLIMTVGRRARWIHQSAVQRVGKNIPVIHFNSTDEAIRTLEEQDDPQVILLIKASRGMQLDRIVEALCAGDPSTVEGGEER